eukprot:GHRR01001273.1.p1 GENE.GHRR01001273.1~~GHRR01001273.1.p1  ORF type:complete len:369 (+),score=179.53 GHRR01001273.1:67-1173(+)
MTLTMRTAAGPMRTCARAFGVPARAFTPCKVVRVAASKSVEQQTAFQIGKIGTLSAVAASWMLSGQAQAATELATLAASDNRFSTIATLFLPALGWVAFNMLQPAFNQLNRMNELKEGGVSLKKRSVAAGAGLAAALTLFGAQQADATTELSQLAASDNRFGTIALLFLPAIGWVAFNILQPAFNQLNRMNELKSEGKPTRGGKKKRGVAGAVGLGAALTVLAAQQADAATELSQLAASDNRFGTIATLFLPALGWVAFNMLQPASNQLNRMNELKGIGSVPARKKRSVAAGAGLGAALTLFAAQNADAATELSQIAASDNRFGTIATLFLPALGWVAFNMLQPAFNQLNRMTELKGDSVPVRKAGRR